MSRTRPAARSPLRRRAAIKKTVPQERDDTRRDDLLRNLEEVPSLSVIGKRARADLEEAKGRDQVYVAGRRRSGVYIRRAKELSDLAARVRKAGRIMEQGITKCSVYPPRQKFRVAQAAQRFSRRVSGGLLGRAALCRAVARYYRIAATDKPVQWGPHTTEAVEHAIEEVHIVLQSAREGLNARWWGRDVRRVESAGFYVGVLCMKVGLLPEVKASPRQLAERVRARMNRCKSLGIALGKSRDVATDLKLSQVFDVADGQAVDWFRRMCLGRRRPTLPAKIAETLYPLEISVEGGEVSGR